LGDLHGLAFHVAHFVQAHGGVAAGVHHFDQVAHGKVVLGFHLHPVALQAHICLALSSQHLAHILAALRGRVAADVVLVVVAGAALQQAAGVAAVGQAFQLDQQLGVERAPATASSIARRYTWAVRAT